MFLCSPTEACSVLTSNRYLFSTMLVDDWVDTDIDRMRPSSELENGFEFCFASSMAFIC